MPYHETDLPTQQKETGAQIRLPQQNEDSCRPRCDQPPPPPRQKAPRRLTFPKGARLLRRVHFQTLAKHGQKWAGEALYIDFLFGPFLLPRLGITVTRRFGKANKRNRFKRCVREAFRSLLPQMPKHLQIHVRPKKGQIAYAHALLDLHHFLSNAPFKSGAASSRRCDRG